jgi:hypothetical protein
MDSDDMCLVKWFQPLSTLGSIPPQNVLVVPQGNMNIGIASKVMWIITKYIKAIQLSNKVKWY